MLVRSKPVCAIVAIAAVLVSGSAIAATGAEMKACEIAVLEKPRFQDLPLAAISVYPGKKANHAHFSIRWQGLKADGNCTMGKNGNIKEVKVKQVHDSRGRHHEDRHRDDNNWQYGNDPGGFYYDRHVNEWRDPRGRVCHTCTAENGFADHGSRHHSDYRPRNHFEREAQRDMRNMLSDEDIRNLNSLTD